MSKANKNIKFGSKQILLIIIALVLICAIVITIVTLAKKSNDNKKYITCINYVDTFLGTSDATTINIDHLEENEYYRIHFDDHTNFTLEYKLTNGNSYTVKGIYSMKDNELILKYTNYPEESFGECTYTKDGDTWVRSDFIVTDSSRFTRNQTFKIGK